MNKYSLIHDNGSKEYVVGNMGLLDLFKSKSRESENKDESGGYKCNTCGEPLWLWGLCPPSGGMRIISGSAVQEEFTRMRRQPRACHVCRKNFCSACTFNSSIKRYICPICGTDLGDLEDKPTFIRNITENIKTGYLDRIEISENIVVKEGLEKIIQKIEKKRKLSYLYHPTMVSISEQGKGYILQISSKKLFYTEDSLYPLFFSQGPLKILN